MEQKTCTKCHETKPIDQFRFQNKAKGKRSPWCKSCFSEHERAKWNESPQRRQRNLERNKQRRLRNQQFIWDYLKEHPCVLCGEQNPILLEFDHRDQSLKENDVSTLTRTAHSLKRINEEIDKCDVLCVKCHRLRTADQMGWYKNIIK